MINTDTNNLAPRLGAAWRIEPAYTDRDYFEYVDGKKRYDGVASLLRSRDVEVPWGDPSDDPSEDTVESLRTRVTELTSENTALRKQVANLLNQLLARPGGAEAPQAEPEDTSAPF